MNMTRCRIGIAGWLLVSAARAAGAGEAPVWSAAIVLPPPGNDSLVSIALTPEVIASCGRHGTSLQVVDEAGQAVPFLFEAAVTSAMVTVRNRWPLKLEALEEPGSNQLRVVVSKPETAPAAAGITLTTSLRDYQRQATVEGSTADGVWQPLASGRLFDVSRYAALRNGDISLPSNGCSRFRITLDGAIDEREEAQAVVTTSGGGPDSGSTARTVRVDRRPFHIAAVEAWNEQTKTVAQEPILTAYPLLSFETNRTGRHGRDLEVLVRTEALPLRQFVVRTPTALVSQPYRLWEQRDGEEADRLLASGRLEAVRFRSFSRASLAIRFEEQLARRYRLELPDAQLDISGLVASGSLYRVVLVVQPGRSYRLVAGKGRSFRMSGHAEPAVRELLDRGYVPAAATLGAVESTIPSRWRQSFGILLLPLAILVAGLALGWAILAANRRLQES